MYDDIMYGMTKADYDDVDRVLNGLRSCGFELEEELKNHHDLLHALAQMADDEDITKEQLAAAIHNIVDLGLPTADAVLDEIQAAVDTFDTATVDVSSWGDDDGCGDITPEQARHLTAMIHDLPEQVVAYYVDALEMRFGPSSPTMPLLRLIYDGITKEG